MTLATKKHKYHEVSLSVRWCAISFKSILCSHTALEDLDPRWLNARSISKSGMFAEVNVRSMFSRPCYLPLHAMCVSEVYISLSCAFCRHGKRVEKLKMLFGLAVNEAKLTSQRTRLKNQNGFHLCRLSREVYTFVSPSRMSGSLWVTSFLYLSSGLLFIEPSY